MESYRPSAHTVYIPVNESVSCVYMLQNLSEKKNVLLVSDERNAGKSLLVGLAVAKGEVESCEISGYASIKMFSVMWNSRMSKNNREGVLLPSKGQFVRFVVEDVSLESIQDNMSLTQYSHDIT
jgi:hypothetical protein